MCLKWKFFGQTPFTIPFFLVTAEWWFVMISEDRRNYYMICINESPISVSNE